MDDPITSSDRFQQALVILAMGGLLILPIGLGLLWVIGRSSPHRRRHGWFVLGWMLAGWMAGGGYGVCLIDNVGYLRGEADVGMAGFGLLVGWAIGMLKGWITLGFAEESQPSVPVPLSGMPVSKPSSALITNCASKVDRDSRSGEEQEIGRGKQ